MADLILLLSSSFSLGMGTVTRVPVLINKFLVCVMMAAASNPFSTRIGLLYSLDEKKKSGIVSLWYVSNGTPSVSNTSTVLPTSSIDLIPADTTVTGVQASSVRSALISNVLSAPLCTPPMPPVTNSFNPARWARYIVAATVVEPFFFIDMA